jgi:carbon-monoxide dehydrogenase large subunit
MAMESRFLFTCYQCPSPQKSIHEIKPDGFSKSDAGENHMIGEKDQHLLTGQAQFTEDLIPANSLHSVFLRSPVGHGHIRQIDIAAAAALPGVKAIYLAADLRAAGITPMRSRAAVTSRDGNPMVEPARPVLADTMVKYVGQPIAMVVADDIAAASDAMEAIDLDIEALPAVNDPETAVHDSAPQIWPEAKNNQSFDWDVGNAAETATHFAEAAHVVRLTVRHPRIAISPMETRACVASYDSDSHRFTLITPSQGVVSLRAALADILAVDESQMHVITPAVGGSFAVKIWPYPEQALCLFAARALCQNVAWTGSRNEAFLADVQGRARVDHARLALDANGHFLAFEVNAVADLGAFLNTVAPMIVTAGAVRVFSQCYRIPGLYYRVQGVFTNAVPVDAYRGANKPESAATLERLIDLAADEIGLDRADLRRRNLIRESDIPYHTAMGEEIDSGAYIAAFDATLARADWHGFPARQAAAAAQGMLRGIAVGSHMHATGGSTAERSRVTALPDGTVEVYTGTQDSGQSHLDTLAQVTADAVGLDADLIKVRQGNSDDLQIGGGTGGSCLMPIAANTIHRAAQTMVEGAKQAASHLLEAAATDLEYAAGYFTVSGTDRRISLAEIVTRWPEIPADQLPPGMHAGCVGEEDFTGRHTTFPNGCYVVEVTVDPNTGMVTLERFTGTDDLGRIFNDGAARGQIIGGLAQAIGEVLMEAVDYDCDGQMVNASLLDYQLPRADEMPVFDLAWRPTNSPHSLLDVKGVGELSSIGGPGPVINAVIHALASRGVKHLDIPLSAQKIWQAIQPQTAPQ